MRVYRVKELGDLSDTYYSGYLSLDNSIQKAKQLNLKTGRIYYSFEVQCTDDEVIDHALQRLLKRYKFGEKLPVLVTNRLKKAGLID